MNRDIALLLARNGKVYYAGDGTRLGLQVDNDVNSGMFTNQHLKFRSKFSKLLFFYSNSIRKL